MVVEEGQGETDSMPLIIRSYCSSHGTLAKCLARAISPWSFSVAAMVEAVSGRIWVCGCGRGNGGSEPSDEEQCVSKVFGDLIRVNGLEYIGRKDECEKGLSQLGSMSLFTLSEIVQKESGTA